MKTWAVVIWFVIFFWNCFAILRRQQRSKKVQNYGKPTEDAFLLVISSLLLVTAMLGALWLFGPEVLDRGSRSRYVFALVFLILAAGITRVANSILRVGGRGKP